MKKSLKLAVAYATAHSMLERLVTACCYMAMGGLLKSLLYGCVKRMAGYDEACYCCVKSLLCGCVAWFGLALAWSFIFLRIPRGSGGFPPSPPQQGFQLNFYQIKKNIFCFLHENIYILRI